MELIDRAALAKDAGMLWSEMPDGEELSKELMKAINHAPTIPAVPLEPLCEWLEKNALIQSGAKANALFWKGIVLATGLLKEGEDG